MTRVRLHLRTVLTLCRYAVRWLYLTALFKLAPDSVLNDEVERRVAFRVAKMELQARELQQRLSSLESTVNDWSTSQQRQLAAAYAMGWDEATRLVKPQRQSITH